jgi:hypothetical protein
VVNLRNVALEAAYKNTRNTKKARKVEHLPCTINHRFCQSRRGSTIKMSSNRGGEETEVIETDIGRGILAREMSSRTQNIGGSEMNLLVTETTGLLYRSISAVRYFDDSENHSGALDALASVEDIEILLDGDPASLRQSRIDQGRSGFTLLDYRASHVEHVRGDEWTKWTSVASLKEASNSEAKRCYIRMADLLVVPNLEEKKLWNIEAAGAKFQTFVCCGIGSDSVGDLHRIINKSKLASSQAGQRWLTCSHNRFSVGECSRNIIRDSDEEERTFVCREIKNWPWKIHCFQIVAGVRPREWSHSFNKDLYYGALITYTYFRMLNHGYAVDASCFLEKLDKCNYQLARTVLCFGSRDEGLLLHLTDIVDEAHECIMLQSCLELVQKDQVQQNHVHDFEADPR